MENSTLVMVPCFSGAPWNLSQMTELKDWPMKTMKLPDDLNNLEDLADFVTSQVKELDSYFLVGDSFGAAISLALATRNPQGLQGLIMSGGFAKNPVTSTVLKILSFLAPYFPGIFYRELTLRVHAYNLRSKFDIEGQIPWSQGKTKQFFTEWTPHKAYVNRVRAAEKCDYVSKLIQIKVPTLILTPEEDRIIGPEASQIMLKGIPNAVEQIIPRTGHMFRFSHPALYSKYIKEFITKLTKEYDELSELPKENKS